MPVVYGGHNLPPLIEIGLTDLQKTIGGFICTFSLLISLSVALQTSNSGVSSQSVQNSKYFDVARYLKQEAYSGPISFKVQRNDI